MCPVIKPDGSNAGKGQRSEEGKWPQTPTKAGAGKHKRRKRDSFFTAENTKSTKREGMMAEHFL
jgi:hypothetical protein